MTNVVATIKEAVMTRLARWLRVGILVGCIGQRIAALFTRRFCAGWWTSVGALPLVRQQLLDPAVQLCAAKRGRRELSLLNSLRPLFHDAIGLHLAAMREDGDAIPLPSSQVEYIDVAA